MSLEFSIPRLDFLQAMTAVQQIAKKSNMPILANVLIFAEKNNISLSSTDMEIALRKTLGCSMVQEGQLTLPAKKLYELARESASEKMEFKEKENCWIEIHAGSSKYRLSGLPASDFPEFPSFNEEKMVQISTAIILDLLDKVLFSIATERENIPSLTNALLHYSGENDRHDLRMVSSDAHRMTFMTREVDECVSHLDIKPNTLIPRKGLIEMRRFCENIDQVFIGVEDKQLVLKNKDDLLITRLSEGIFPDFLAIENMADNELSVSVPRVEFLDALKRIDLFSEDIFHAIRMDISSGKIFLRSKNSDYGSADDEIEVSYSDVDISIAFNCRYLIETLQVMNGENIIINFSSNEDKPCKISSIDDLGFLSIIMPMKI